MLLMGLDYHYNYFKQRILVEKWSFKNLEGVWSTAHLTRDVLGGILSGVNSIHKFRLKYSKIRYIERYKRRYRDIYVVCIYV